MVLVYAACCQTSACTGFSRVLHQGGDALACQQGSAHANAEQVPCRTFCQVERAGSASGGQVSDQLAVQRAGSANGWQVLPVEGRLLFQLGHEREMV